MTPQVFVPVVSAAGLLVVGHCISALVQQPFEVEWLALAALTLLTGCFTIKIPSIPVRLSVSETFVFASVLLFGVCAGTITVAVEVLVVIAVGTGRRARDPLRILFNVSSATLSIWLAGHAFFAVTGITPLNDSHAPVHTLILPLAMMSAIYFLLNSGMVAAAVALQSGQPIFRMWRGNFSGLAVNYFGGASLAALFISYTSTIDLVRLGVIIVPLLITCYLTFKTAFSRVEDATRHIEEIKTLYLSTIETLATAIDAKDQVTHGHIRRVQQLALGLAREIGVADRSQIQALQAAALLHDTGKLAIPEHILNKPGKLTHGEFERMKEHARLGAEILSSISFPYPVVPIVRHHHENWDGTGYPDGLRGTQIPIGARILAVVDCFDALTSDRPYRRRMTDSDALRILQQRRATMYDPLVVDTFTENWETLVATVDADVKSESHTLSGRASHVPLPAVAAHSKTILPLEELADGVLSHTGADVVVMFGADRDSDQLRSMITRTREGNINTPLSIPLGYGVSGWVAVNGTTLLNADASLDFRGDAPLPNLVRSICVPVRIKGQTAGVLSTYTTDLRGFTEEDKLAIEQLIASSNAESALSTFHTVLGPSKMPETSRTIH